MPALYRIKDWSAKFENNRTRSLKEMPWLPLPTRRDGRIYRRLVRLPLGRACYGTFCALLGIAALCTPRGDLVRDDGTPLDFEDLENMTGIAREDLRHDMEVLSSEQIGWMVVVDCQDPAPSCQMDVDRVENIKQEKKQERSAEEIGAPAGAPQARVRDTPEALQTAWNTMAATAGLPRWREMPSGRRRSALARLRERTIDGPDGWLAVLRKVVDSPFLTGKVATPGRDAFRCDPDFLLRPDTASRILEGRYDDRASATSSRPVHHGRAVDFEAVDYSKR